MQNLYMFHPKRHKRVLGITAAALITFNILTGVALFTDGQKKDVAVVYAAAQETVKTEATAEAASLMEEAPADTSAETEQVEQIQLDEQMAEIARESVAAMQNDLAIETAREENKIQLSKKDKDVLLRIVEAEATGEDVAGKMLVANVILNRVNSEKFPDSVEAVVFQRSGRKYQFSPIRDGRYYKVQISDTTEEAVERVLYGEDESKGALYFMSRRQASKGNVRWFDRSLTFLLEYGTHEFYK